MDLVGVVVVFIISWWLSLFCVLPIGIRSHDEAGDDAVIGNDTGAPSDAMIGKKAIWAVYGAVGLTSLTALFIHVFLTA